MRYVSWLLLLFALACSKPEPPRVLPQAVRLTAISATDVRLAVDLDVYNPNSFPLLVSSVTGKLEVGGGIEIGSGQATVNGSIPAKGSSLVTATIALAWTNLPAAFLAGQGKPALPYTFRGTAGIGSERLNVDVPFTLTGELTQAQLLQAGLRGLGSLPGFAPAPAQ